MYPKNREEYHQAFLEVYSKSPWKDRMIEKSGQKYYDEVMRIHQERLDKKDFDNIGPQTEDQWNELRLKIEGEKK